MAKPFLCTSRQLRCFESKGIRGTVPFVFDEIDELMTRGLNIAAILPTREHTPSQVADRGVRVTQHQILFFAALRAALSRDGEPERELG